MNRVPFLLLLTCFFLALKQSFRSFSGATWIAHIKEVGIVVAVTVTVTATATNRNSTFSYKTTSPRFAFRRYLLQTIVFAGEEQKVSNVP